jgi:hypothetical protein
MYKHEHYPKVLYHATEGEKTVASQEEHEALGDEWVESPAEFEKKEAKAAKPEGDKKSAKASKAKAAKPEGE